MKNYLLTFLRPKQSFERLLADPQYFRLGFIYILVPIVCYTLMYVFLTIAHGAPSVFTPWLNIPKESYYSMNRFLLAPSMIACWWLSSSWIQIAGRINGSKGSFEQTLSTIALGISISMWGGLIHDLPMSFFSAAGIIDAKQHEIDMNSPTIFRTLLWICYFLYFILFLIMFPMAVKVVHKFNWGKSIVIGVVGFIIFQVMFLVFNR